MALQREGAAAGSDQLPYGGPNPNLNLTTGPRDVVAQATSVLVDNYPADGWADVPGFVGAYQLHPSGVVRSLDREITDRNGRRLRCPGVVLHVDRGCVQLSHCRDRRTFSVAKLVADVFGGDR